MDDEPDDLRETVMLLKAQVVALESLVLALFQAHTNPEGLKRRFALLTKAVDEAWLFEPIAERQLQMIEFAVKLLAEHLARDDLPPFDVPAPRTER